MSYRLVSGTVRESQRRAIYVVRVQDAVLDSMQADDIAERMREWLQSRGEMVADVIVTEGDSRDTLRFFGHSYSISVVRAALFNAAVSWTPIELS